jgi:hypothetical protein
MFTELAKKWRSARPPVQDCDCPNGVNNGPGSFHRVFANEEHGISTHRISQKTFSFSEIDGDDDEFTNVTGPILHLEPTNFVRTVALGAL